MARSQGSAATPSDGVAAPGNLASVNGAELYYEVHGEGPPLVLLHGFFGSIATWARYIPHLAEHYRVIAIDLRGHGRSTNPSGEFTHRQAARDVLALLDLLGIGRFCAMGASSGAMTLIHAATQQPDRPEALILCCGTSYFPPQAREIMSQRTAENSTEEQWRAWRQRHQRGDDQIRALIRQFHGFQHSYADMNFTPPYLSTITARTLIVHGDRDAFFPVEIPLEMYRAIPRSYLWIIPNWGHAGLDSGSAALMALFIETAQTFLAGDWEA